MRVRMVKSRTDNLGLLAAGQRWRKTIGSCTVAIGRKERLRDATSQVGQHFQDAGTFALDKSSELEELMVLQPQVRVISTGSLIRNRWRSSCGDRWLSPALTISDVRQLVHLDKNICPQVSLNQIVQPTRRHLYWVIHNMTETRIFQRC